MEFPAVGFLYYTDGSLRYPGTQGYYWSSVQSNTDNAHRMYFVGSSIDVNTNGKRAGFSVRCVRQRIYDPDFLHKIQNIT